MPMMDIRKMRVRVLLRLMGMLMNMTLAPLSSWMSMGMVTVVVLVPVFVFDCPVHMNVRMFANK
jgi:hypothetical protein